MKYLDYIFYKFNSLILFKSFSKNDSSYINTYIGLAALPTFNILSILLIIKTEFDLKNIVFLFFILMFISYLTFIRKKRYLKIIEYYKKNDPYPILGKVILICYSVITFLFIIFSAWYAKQIKYDIL